MKYPHNILVLARTKVFHVLGWTGWTGWTTASRCHLWEIHERSASFRAAAWLSVRSVVALIVWSIGTVVKATLVLGMVITHGKVIGTTPSTVHRAALWMASLVTVVIWGIGTDAAACRRRWRAGRLDVQGACLIQAFASSSLTIVLEAHELVRRRTLIASSCGVATSTFDTKGAASTSSCI